MKNKSIMIQGTASSVGKSLVTAALCRILVQDGYKTAPFKSQNMALNSYITIDGLEMGRAQVVQAEAAGIEPTIEMNPILLKPTSDSKCQVVLNGKVFGNMTAREYFDYKPRLGEMIKETYEGLSSKNDVVVIEGAGSPAEINLRDNDIVNMGMAEIADSPVILVGDIDRGGVFASIAGTLLLLRDDEKRRVKGVIINKFRGDIDLLKPGMKMLEDIIKIPVIGVIPYHNIVIDDEDSVTEKFSHGSGSSEDVNIAVIKLPHLSNFTDFSIFDTAKNVSIKYVSRPKDLAGADLIIIPGTKNTMDDMVFLKATGLDEEIKKMNGKGILVFGVCGGYQILGSLIEDSKSLESDISSIDGLGLIEVKTRFESGKVTTRSQGHIVDDLGIFNLSENVKLRGYEIHMGRTEISDSCNIFLRLENGEAGGVVNHDLTVFGTYLHGIFDNEEFTRDILNHIRRKKGILEESLVGSYKDFKESQYDQLAQVVRESVDMDEIYRIIGL